eukprot:jgi/Chrzof1/14835/Cz09g17310.t1
MYAWCIHEDDWVFLQGATTGASGSWDVWHVGANIRAAPGRLQRALFDLYVSWAQHSPKETLPQLEQLLSSLQLATMSLSELKGICRQSLAMQTSCFKDLMLDALVRQSAQHGSHSSAELGGSSTCADMDQQVTDASRVAVAHDTGVPGVWDGAEGYVPGGRGLFAAAGYARPRMLNAIRGMALQAREVPGARLAQ